MFTEDYYQFIGLYSNIFPEGFSEFLISEFERIKSEGNFVHSRQSGEGVKKSLKDDNYVFLSDLHNDGEYLKEEHDLELNFGSDDASCLKTFKHPNGEYRDVVRVIIECLQDCLDRYIQRYSTLSGEDHNMRGSCIKMQKTQPGGGYHVWHAEQSCEEPQRVLVWSIYLNDIDEAGETEFLYQKFRLPPKKDSCAIFPAAFTHTHRGNVVHGEKDKYILTGWFYYV